MNQFQSLDEIFSALKRRARIIVAITFVGCMLSLFFTLSQSKIYETTAVVQIEDARVPDRLVGATAQAEDAARRVRLIEQRLMSRDNLLRIMEKHDLFSADPTLVLNERIFMMREAAKVTPIVNQAQPFAPGANVPSGLLITVRLDNPQKAADLANELMYSVIDQSRDRSTSRARDTLEFFAAEEATVRANIEELEAQIAGFKGANAESLPEGLGDLRIQLAALRETVLNLDQDILSLKTDSNRQREEVKDGQIALLEERKLLIVERAVQLQTQLAAAPEVERTLNNLERQMTQLQEQYSVITRRRAEAELGQMLEDRQQNDRYEVLETALAPEYAVSRSRKKTAVLGAVASVLAGIGAAFAIESMNPPIRSAAQMERALGIRPVVAIPYIAAPSTRTQKGLKILVWVAALAAIATAIVAAVGAFLPGGSGPSVLQKTARN